MKIYNLEVCASYIVKDLLINRDKSKTKRYK
jgi:hypothetical protein